MLLTTWDMMSGGTEVGQASCSTSFIGKSGGRACSNSTVSRSISVRIAGGMWQSVYWQRAGGGRCGSSSIRAQQSCGAPGESGTGSYHARMSLALHSSRICTSARPSSSSFTRLTVAIHSWVVRGFRAVGAYTKSPWCSITLLSSHRCLGSTTCNFIVSCGRTFVDMTKTGRSRMMCASRAM